jgi:NitT/TauT family transport system substrate-binding protein
VTTPLPLVDCCHEGEAARRPDSGISPFVIHPNPLHRPLSRRRAFRRVAAVTAVTAAGVAAACGSGDGSSTQQAGAPVPDAAGRSSAPTSEPVAARLEEVDLAFCSQVLCVLPFEVAERRGFFKAEGIRAKLVYMKGGALAMQSLLGGSVDFVGTPMDVVVSAHGSGKNPVMVASTSSLPFFALVTAPKAKIESVQDLKGKKVGVGNLNTTDHLIVRYLAEKNGIDDASVQFVALGPNLYDALVRGQVDAGMVQEPALTLAQREGSRVLVNFMSRADTTAQMGGAYQFMGLNTRPDVLEKRPETLKKLIRGLVQANRWIRSAPGSEIVKNIPEELVAGGDLDVFAASLDQFKSDLYPDNARLDAASIQRVIDVQKLSGALEREVAIDAVYTNSLLG